MLPEKRDRPTLSKARASASEKTKEKGKNET
jgi:hypothetical protein